MCSSFYCSGVVSTFGLYVLLYCILLLYNNIGRGYLSAFLCYLLLSVLMFVYGLLLYFILILVVVIALLLCVSQSCQSLVCFVCNCFIPH